MTILRSSSASGDLFLRKQAEADLAAAKESGVQEDVDKYSRRLVKVTQQHNDDCKELLRLMGVPVITAPCEAGLSCRLTSIQGNKQFARGAVC